jgi:hypothetical protein
VLKAAACRQQQNAQVETPILLQQCWETWSKAQCLLIASSLPIGKQKLSLMQSLCEIVTPVAVVLKEQFLVSGCTPVTKVLRWYVVLIRRMAPSPGPWAPLMDALTGHAICTNRIWIAQMVPNNSSTAAVQQVPAGQTV